MTFEEKLFRLVELNRKQLFFSSSDFYPHEILEELLGNDYSDAIKEFENLELSDDEILDVLDEIGRKNIPYNQALCNSMNTNAGYSDELFTVIESHCPVCYKRKLFIRCHNLARTCEVANDNKEFPEFFLPEIDDCCQECEKKAVDKI